MNKVAQLYKQHAEEIYRFAYIKTQNAEQAQDAMAEAFKRLLEQDIDSIANHRAWLYKTTRNIIIDTFRKQVNVDEVEDVMIDESTYANISMEKTVLDQQTIELIKGKLEMLDEKYREVITLKLWNELTFEEIAEIINIKLSATKQRYYRGIEQLMEMVNQPERKTLTFTAPILLYGVYQARSLPEFTLPTSIFQTIGSQLFNISFAKTAGSSTVAGGVFSTTIGKATITILAGATLIGGGIGAATFIQSQQGEEESNVCVYGAVDYEPGESYTNDNEQCTCGQDGAFTCEPIAVSSAVIGEPESFATCVNSDLEIDIKIPSTITCVHRESDSNGTLGYTILSFDDISLQFSDENIGFSPGACATAPCARTVIESNNKYELYYLLYDGAFAFDPNPHRYLVGFMKNKPLNIWIDYPDVTNTDISATDYTQVIKLIDLVAQNPSDPTAHWNRYELPEFGISIAVPDEFIIETVQIAGDTRYTIKTTLTTDTAGLPTTILLISNELVAWSYQPQDGPLESNPIEMPSLTILNQQVQFDKYQLGDGGPCGSGGLTLYNTVINSNTHVLIGTYQNISSCDENGNALPESQWVSTETSQLEIDLARLSLESIELL